MINKLLILSLASLLSLSLQAEDAKNHPCQKIKTACESAGFKKGDHKKNKKGLHVDCMKPVMAGQTVAGVTVSAEDISACKVKQVEHKAKKEAKK
jgi:hypothetical protein